MENLFIHIREIRRKWEIAPVGILVRFSVISADIRAFHSPLDLAKRQAYLLRIFDTK